MSKHSFQVVVCGVVVASGRVAVDPKGRPAISVAGPALIVAMFHEAAERMRDSAAITVYAEAV